MTSNVAEEEENMAKRRRMEGGENGSRPQTRNSRAFSSPNQEYDEEEERQYRRDMAARQSSRRSERKIQGYSPKRDVEHFKASSMAAPQPSSAERRDSAMLVEDGFDSNVPLARRRGDAAHAKASRLHIDTGSSEPSSGGGIGSNLESGTIRKSLSSMSMHGIAKSAPPHKMSFTDREGLPFDPRGEPPPLHSTSRAYANGPLASTQPYYPSVYTRKEAASQETHNFNDASPNHSRRTEYGPQHQQVASQNQSQHPSHRHGLSSVATPLTAMRSNAFIPQTATLPSPAYHTTHFMRNPMGQDVRGSSSAAGATGAPPKTAGLNPPQTARLPEHLRSPPSSKTQFLSLFSNFYDSLTDSRTLKATLEDQVRRSNTLLQTLQKSSRVLELTVDRRVREERILWESKVQALEDRCLRLEKQLGTATEDGPLFAQSTSSVESNGSRKSPSQQQDLVRSTTTTLPSVEAKESSESNEVQMDE